MKRCPKCNRNYPTDTQRFCTHDGGMLIPVEVNTGETAADVDVANAPTKVISRELVSENTVTFDPFKTMIDPGPPERERTSEVRGRDTRDLSTQSPPPPRPSYQTSAPLPPPPSGPISQSLGEGTLPSMPSASSQPPAPQQTSAPLSQPVSGPISQPLPEVSAPLPAPPPSMTSGSLPQAGSGPIATSAPLPAPPPSMTSGSLPQAGSGPIGTSAPLPVPSSGPLPSTEIPVTSQPQPAQPMIAPPPKKKSKAPLIIGILAVLFILFVAVVGVAYVFVIRPALEARRAAAIPVESSKPREANPAAETTPVETTNPATTSDSSKTATESEPPAYNPPADAVQFVNSNRNLRDKLAEHYVEFSFYYPKRWEKDPRSGGSGSENFIEVHRQLPPNFTQESVAISWYDSAGSFQLDQASFPSFIEKKSSQFAQSITQYHKTSEGPTKVGVYDGYEFRFEGVSQKTEKGQFKIWGRVIWLPPRDGSQSGVTLLMLTTSLAPELTGVEDVGEKGELPMILESFRFGRSASG